MRYFVIDEDDEKEITELLDIAIHSMTMDTLAFKKIKRFLERSEISNRYKEIFKNMVIGQFTGLYVEPDRRDYYKNVILKQEKQ
jgi:hypothetical protein